MMVRIVPPQPWLPGEPQGPAQGSAFIAWKPQCYRSTMTARCFGADLWLVAPFQGQARWRKVARYLASFLITVSLLFARRPRFVFVLNQPLPLLVAAALYAIPFRRPLILDCHSNAFAPGPSGLAMSVYRAATQRALVNINHNRSDEHAVRRMGGQSCVIPEIPGQIEANGAAPMTLARPNALVVCSFAKDEPLDLVLAAAAAAPDVQFYLTGDHRKAGPALAETKPANVHLLGFLSTEDYIRHVFAAMVVVTLSTRSHIMQMAAEEALAMAVPLVTNHSAVLEEVFGDAALFVPLDAGELARAVQLAVRQNGPYRDRMSARREIRRDHLRRTLKAVGPSFVRQAGR